MRLIVKMFFVVGKSTSVYLWLFALLGLGWGQDIADIAQAKSNFAADWSPFLPSTGTLGSSRLPRASPEVAKPTVCGKTIARQGPLLLNGSAPQIDDLPWHANIYRERMRGKGSKKEYICGAIMIQDNLLLTAAHCVYDEATRTTSDPRKLFVMMGNVIPDYDSPQHDPSTVRKGAIKDMYINCQYYGLAGNYGSDIAVLELQEPFNLSDTISPACLDLDADNSQLLEAGAYGKIAGYGRMGSGASSGMLRINTVPYITYGQCKAGVEPRFLTPDKFCTGNSNASAICGGDSGAGIVSEKNDLWYVTGILSVGFGGDNRNGGAMCDKSYLLYTRVSTYVGWIQKIMSELKEHKSHSSCAPDI